MPKQNKNRYPRTLAARHRSITGEGSAQISVSSGDGTMVNISQLTFSILGYREDDCWCALALEFDLRGHGATPDEAMQELMKMVTAQIAYAVQEQDASLLDFAADQEYFDLYEQTKRDMILQGLFHCEKDSLLEQFAANAAIPEPYMLDALGNGFARNHA